MYAHEHVPDYLLRTRVCESYTADSMRYRGASSIIVDTDGNNTVQELTKRLSAHPQTHTPNVLLRGTIVNTW